jgi:hypothetical protein
MVEGVTPASIHERGIGEVLVVWHVVRLVLEAERLGIELPPHLLLREAWHRVVPAGEGVVVVET